MNKIKLNISNHIIRIIGFLTLGVLMVLVECFEKVDEIVDEVNTSKF